MITIHNYFNEIVNLDRTIFHDALNKGHEFVMKATNNGSSWAAYHSSEGIKKTIDLYLGKLNEFLGQHNKTKANAGRKGVKAAKPEAEKPKTSRRAKKETGQAAKAAIPETAQQNESTDAEVTLVERISEELKFIRRFINLNGKTKTKEQVLSIINSLQKAILEKRIRKTSQYADQIRMIQEKLINLYNSMKAKIRIELKPETFDELKQLTGEQKILPSISFIKRYIGMNAKPGMKERAKKLLEQINRAMDKSKLSDNDPYISEIHTLKKNLKAFTTSKSQKTLEIEKAELNGLQGVLGCACQQLNGLDELPPVMNSMDFANVEFDTIGLRGKWYELIGDPSSNFTAMVYGKPKMGKSYLCIDFAGYLARHHGKVLYVAKEEGLDMTLQKKLNEKNVKHPNLYVASVLPSDLSRYDFIFLDSVNRLGLKPEDLNNLKVRNPAKSFVFIFQSTKMGDFRGANSFQHDVDVVIEVPEKGKAVQMGRFNQGGEMEIFERNERGMAA